MNNFFKKAVSKYKEFLENNSVKKTIEYVMIAYITLIFLSYCFYYEYIEFITTVAWSLFFFILFSIFIFGPKTKIDFAAFQKISSIFSIKKSYDFQLKNFLFFMPFFLIFIANTLVLPLILSKDNSDFIDILFYESNIINKIFLILIFYYLLFLLAIAVGRKILSLINLEFDSNQEQFIFSIGLGFIPLMLGTFLIAISSWLYASVIWTFIALLLLFSGKEILKIFKEIESKKITISFSTSFLSLRSAAILFMFFMLAINFIINIKPIPITTDDLHTYFNAPNLYVSNHEYRPLYHVATANMGQNIEMVYAAIMSITNSAYIIHFQFFFFVLSLFAFYQLLKKLFDEPHALLGVLLLFTIPWNSYYISNTKIEMSLVFYSVLLLSLFFLWLGNKEKKILCILGVLAGIALGIKYTSAMVIAPIYFLILISVFLDKQKNFKPVVISILLAILFFSPWALKNQYYFNNIFFPYELVSANTKSFDLLPADPSYDEARKNEINQLRHGLISSDKFSFKTFFVAIWKQSLGKDLDKGHWINFGFLPLLITPFYLFFKKEKKLSIYLFISMIYFLLWYALEGARTWYAIFGIMLLYASAPFLLLKNKFLSLFAVFFSLVISIFTLFVLQTNIDYLIGAENVGSYAQKSISYYKTAEFINDNLKLENGEKILIAGDFRTAFINNNDKITYCDSYLKKISYSINQGDDIFYDSLKNSSFAYVVYSKIMLDNFYQAWPNNHNITTENYLLNYKGKHPSIYQNIRQLNSFLNKNAVIIYEDDYNKLYKLK